MTFKSQIENLKEQVDIIKVADQLGCQPSRQTGNCYQGACCPGGHDSDGEKCFVIWPEIQAFRCYHCGIKGDVIELVMRVQKIGFREAINWLADHTGIPRLITKDMTSKEKAEYEHKVQEQKTIFNILTDGAAFYHQSLMAEEGMKSHLISHYGLSENTITKYLLGYSIGSGLMKYLRNRGISEYTMKKCGLFVNVGDSLKEFFNCRLIFPYWKSGKVVYFIGRRTDKTPDNKWEQGKYKKLPVRSEKQQYISEFIKNRHFYGEDSIRGADKVYVAEGVTDCLLMLQAGYPTISPATTRLSNESIPHLNHLSRNVKTIYLCPDNEKNQAGIKGAMDTAERLEQAGKSVFIMTLPRPEGVEKIDANEFLRNHGKEAFEKLISEAKSPLQLEIDDIAKERLDLLRLSDRLGPVKEKLSMLPQDKQVGYLEYAKRVLKVRADFIQAMGREIKLTKCDKASEENETETLSALFPDLIDLVINDGQIAYLYQSDEGLKVNSSFDHLGVRLIPPTAKSIPFPLVPASEILSHQNDFDLTLYWDILEKLKSVSVLPSPKYYHLCSTYIFFTYVWESCAYYPYLWFFGLQERGKSRIVKAIISLSYRGLYTETLNEAYIFRFADLFRGTLALDLYELSERAQKKGSQDLLLGRYEKGMRVARVIAPDKGAFKDTEYFTVSGPTVLATNVEIPAKDPLQSRCIKITMPEARGIYPNNNTDGDLMNLKAGLLAFRARHLGQALPNVDKPIAGRLGDIMQPLLCVAKLLPSESSEALRELIEEFETERKEAEPESLAGSIIQALYDLKFEVENGRLPVEKVRGKINEGVDERFFIAPQTIGRELSAMGLKRKKSGGIKQIIWDENAIEKLWHRYPPEGYVPFLPNVPQPTKSRVSEGDKENCFVPYVPQDGDERDKPKCTLPTGEPCKSGVRDKRDKRDITPGGDGQFTFLETNETIEEGVL